MKVAFLSPVSLREWGGVENWIFQMAESLTAKHHDVLVVSNAVTWKKRLELMPPHNFRYLELPTFNVVNVKPSVVLLRIPLWFKDFDVVYLYHNSLAYSYQALHKCKQPVVLGIHYDIFAKMNSQFVQKFYRYFFNHLSLRANKIACRSNNHIEFMNKTLKVKRNKLFLNRTFVDAKRFSPSKSKEHFTVLFVGRFAEEKDVPTFLRAIKHLDSNIRFVIVGNGDKNYEAMVKKWTQKFPNVIWKNVLVGKELADVFAHASVLVNPSQSEVFPNVVLQALSCGTPVILSKIPAHQELAEMLPKDTFSLFTCGDPIELAEAIKKWQSIVMSDKERYNKACSTSNNFIRTHFSEAQATDSFESMLSEVSKV